MDGDRKYLIRSHSGHYWDGRANWVEKKCAFRFVYRQDAEEKIEELQPGQHGTLRVEELVC